MKEIEKEIKEEGLPVENAIDRKDAIKKIGYISLSAATMLLLLNKPNRAVASSPASPGPW
jgi:hypothetical protein